MDEREGDGDDEPEQYERVEHAHRESAHGRMIASGTGTSTRGRSAVALGETVRLLRLALFTTLFAMLLTACGAPSREPGTVVMASGTDLESGNPLVTIHPLSRQLQRHALFLTLVRLDSLLQPEPYAARAWHWDADRRAITFELLPELRWHDGIPLTARDVAFTLEAAADSSPGVAAPRRCGDRGTGHRAG